MPRALDVRPTAVLMLALALCAALLALAPAGPAHAQAPAGVVDAATAHLAEQLEVDPAGLALLRSEAVTWSDGCLGVYEAEMACTTALVDGFALWLSDGDVAYRYHSDATGTAVRLAEPGIPLAQVEGAPLPEGQVAPPPPEDVAVSALDRFLDQLAAATGVDDIYTREIAIERDWIPGAFSPHYVVADATLEIFELPTEAAADDALARLRQFGGETDLDAGEALWRHESLLIVLLHASRYPETLAQISGLIGPPLVQPAIALSPPEPGPADVAPSPASADDATANPGALPTSGSGGLADDSDAPPWVWGVIAAVALSAIATGGAYRLWLRSRGR